MPQIKVEEQISGTIIYLEGQFVGGKETDKLSKILKKVAEEKKKILIINLEKVTYLNSIVLGILISAHTNFAKRGGKIILCNISKSIENIFVITKLTLVFEITDTLSEAIKLINK